MSRLDLDKLKQYKNEILKAEIGALLFNLGKTHIGFWKEKEDKDGNKISYFNIDENSFKNIYGFGPFSGYRKYYQRDNELNKSPFEYELEKNGLKDFIFNRNISFPFNVLIKDENRKEEREKIEWQEIFKGDASEIEFIKRVFFRGCENINSGIDKGSPNKQLEPPLWLSNAFGSFKEEIKEHNFDQRRICFYTNLSRFLSINGYFQNPNWNEIRNFILKEIKDWYSHLLSDSRFPINDVTLFDQAYMTASMFKAVLSQLVMNSSKINDYQDNPSSIKWRILGIQYDKSGIAEKGLKLASIQWYREITEKIDKELKKLLEVEYPIGNEIYRDETGIYFIVGESIEKLPDEIEEKIKNIFENTKLDDREIEGLKNEVFSSISFSEPSRGLMNLSALLENTKIKFSERKRIESVNFEFDTITHNGKEYKVKKGNNFTRITKKDPNTGEEIQESIPNTAIGICPICQVRLIYMEDTKRNNKPTICEICDKRIHHFKASRWIKNISGETIWLDEVKDKNNRIVYISLKFELEDWLNGSLLNSFLGNKGYYSYNKEKEILKEILKNGIAFIDIENILIKTSLKKFINDYFILLEEIKHFYQSIGNRLYSSLDKLNSKRKGRLTGLLNKELDNIVRILEYLGENSIEGLKLLDRRLEIDIFNLKKLLKKLKNYLEKFCKLNLEDISSDIEINENYKKLVNIFKTLNLDTVEKFATNKELHEELLKSVHPFKINPQLVDYYSNFKNSKDFFEVVFFSSIIGTQWESWIKETSLNSKIDWTNEKIKWEEFNEENDPALDLLATLLLQFLLRKNPSPARLRRIWETTREFFEDIHKDLDKILGIPEWRKKRIYFEIEDKHIVNKIKKTGEELEGDGLSYWVLPEGKKARFYLISSIEDFILKYGNKTKETLLNLRKETNKEEIEKLNNYLSEGLFSIEKEIAEHKSGEKISFKNYGDKEELFSISKNDIKEFKLIPYKPFAKITDPSPKNYQVVIPAEYLERFLDKVMERYNKEFKYVYGKLPLHIGIVVSHYKKPAYVNLKALRRIRRDIKDINKLYELKNVREFCVYQKKKLSLATPEELVNNTESYYSLYWNNPDCRDYNFYIKPNNKWKKWISTIDKFPQNSNVEIISNTFDFEFMDTNTRRNDIFYDEGNGYKRAIPDKSNRPYEIEEYWNKFKEFRKIFKEKSTSSKLHNLVHILYDKLKDFDEKYAPLLASSFIKILELNKKENEKIKKGIIFIFDIDINQDFYEELKNKLKEKENIKLFLDMFEFWHTMLKEV